MEFKTLLLIAAGVAGYLLIGYLIASSIRSSARGVSLALQVPMKNDELKKSIIFLWPFKFLGL